MIRTCIMCGKAFYDGMFDGEFNGGYVHEKCFSAYMNSKYGYKQWKSNNHKHREEDDEGFYLIKGDDRKWHDVEIYYSTWYPWDEYNGSITYECEIPTRCSETKTETVVFSDLDKALDFVRYMRLTNTINMYVTNDGVRELVDSEVIK